MKNLKQTFFYVAAIGVSSILLFLFIGASWIGYEVKNQCQEAQGEYEGDCVEALSSLLQDQTQKFRARNDTVWALGQLGDNRALPILKNYYTGNIPLREPLDQTISQYELKKAINLTSGGLNITAFFWRGMLNMSD